MTRSHMLAGIVFGVIVACALFALIDGGHRDKQPGAASYSAGPVRASSAREIPSRQDDLRERRQNLVDQLNRSFSKPAVGGPLFLAVGRRTGIWKWSNDDSDAALVMIPQDYIQPRSYDQIAVCSYLYPIVANFGLEKGGFKNLIIAFPHQNMSCDVEQMTAQDAMRRTVLADFETKQMTDLRLDPSRTQWEEGSRRVLPGGHEIVVVGMKSTMLNNNYRLISVIYWWRLDLDNGDAEQLAGFDPR